MDIEMLSLLQARKIQDYKDVLPDQQHLILAGKQATSFEVEPSKQLLLRLSQASNSFGKAD